MEEQGPARHLRARGTKVAVYSVVWYFQSIAGRVHVIGPHPAEPVASWSETMSCYHAARPGPFRNIIETDAHALKVPVTGPATSERARAHGPPPLASCRGEAGFIEKAEYSDCANVRPQSSARGLQGRI